MVIGTPDKGQRGAGTGNGTKQTEETGKLIIRTQMTTSKVPRNHPHRHNIDIGCGMEIKRQKETDEGNEGIAGRAWESLYTTAILSWTPKLPSYIAVSHDLLSISNVWLCHADDNGPSYTAQAEKSKPTLTMISVFLHFAPVKHVQLSEATQKRRP
ncbi:hypothetical protein BDN71DRAFT_1433224 [Pleurotus eryngii]|uniref:Uncharacterized protein n=1 Tax=Pleurotus eryngii TaxID=5323 RepID=A0A9P6D4M0_PLEER|nr:hypothetical protein BDN71DRAFT_1433224 [Pleurotus eryngii]